MIRLKQLALVLLAAFAMGAQAQTTEFTWMVWWGGAAGEVLEEVIAAYREVRPDVRINVHTIAGTGAAGYLNALRIAIAGGRAPDLWNIWGGTLAAPFIDARQVIDTAPYFEKFGWDNIMIPAAISAIKRDGTTWGIPITLRAMSLYYRRDIFARYDLRVPSTFAELEELCARLGQENIPCLTTAGIYGWHAMRVFQFFLEHTAGPELHDQLLANTTSWDRPEVEQAFALLKRWADNGWLTSGFMGIPPAQSQQLFLQGRAAMIIEGDWFVTTVLGANLNSDQVGFFIPPTDRLPLRMSGFAEQLMISRQSRNADAAAEFVNWLLQPANQREFYALKGSTVIKGGMPTETANPMAVAYAEMVAKADVYLVMDQALPVEFMNTTFFRLQSEVVAGRTTPADAARQMEQAASQLR